MSVDRSVPAEIEDVLALSPLQEGLFSLAQLAGEGVDLYTMQFVIDIGGPIDVPVLRRSAEVILERHANLRASFWDQDLPKPVQIVPTWVELPWLEISALPTEFDGIAEADRGQRFDLGRGPALRITLVSLPDGRRRMIVTAHHILMDGWAVAVFFRELIAVYEAGGQADSLPKARPYRDYIGWLAAHDATAALRSWTEYLAELSGPLMLADGNAAEVGTVIPRRTRLSLDRTETDRLVRWARERPHHEHRRAVRLGGGARPPHRSPRCGLRHHHFRAAGFAARCGNHDRAVHQYRAHSGRAEPHRDCRAAVCAVAA
jgi:mycobactin peptide synthetase MbtF